MKLIDDDGTEIKISEETAQNIRDARKPKGREQFGCIEISLRENFGYYPIRIKIVNGCHTDGGKNPGDILNIEKARQMAHYILKLCDELEKK